MSIKPSLHFRQEQLEVILKRTLNPLQRVSQVHCAAPITPPKLRLKCILHISITATYWITFVILAFKNIFDNPDGRNSLEHFLFALRFALSLFICATIFVGCHRVRKLYPHFVKRIVHIHVQMEFFTNLSLDPCGRLRFYINRYLGGFLFVELFICILEIISVDYDMVNAFVDVLTLIIPSMIATMALMQFIGMLYILKDEFCKLNEVIQENHFPKWKTRESCVVYSLTPILKQRRRLAHSNDQENILNSARQLHIELTELYDKGTSSFGILLVSVFVQTTLQFIIQLYLMYRYLVNLKEISWLVCIYCIMWIFLHGAPLYVLFFVADLLHKEVIPDLNL